MQALGTPLYRDGFKLTVQPQALALPKQWRKPRVIFVNSMSDLFHKLVPSDYIKQVFDVMNECTWHTFQILTKRPERAAGFYTTANAEYDFDNVQLIGDSLSSTTTYAHNARQRTHQHDPT